MSEYVPGPYDLRRGDSDAMKRWGGVIHPHATGRHVHDLQEALVDLGVLLGTPDGGFGSKTESALKRFQWYLKNVRVRLTAAGQAVPYQSGFAGTATGIFAAATRQRLADFTNGAYACAGPLVRVNFTSLPRFRASGSFVPLIGGLSAMVVDRQFSSMLTAMNAKAQQESLYVFVNQVFRLAGAPVSGAVVPPADHSAHKLGRAIDLQLGTTPAAASPAAATMNAAANSAMGRFREHLKNLGCRYGGSFNSPDPPHFDQQVFPTGGEDWKDRFFFAQQQYTGGPLPGSSATRIPTT